MTNNIIGIIASFVLILIIISVSTILQKIKIIGEEGSRKLIHIGVSHCWIIVMLFFDNVWLACVPPAVFIILNYISYKYNLIKSMERQEKDSLGTVYFPVSLLLLVLITFYLKMPYIGAVGIFILGYGDGLAGLIGKKYGTNKIFKNKTAEGTTAMFTASLIVSLIVLSLFSPSIAISGSIIIAALSTAIELFTPGDLDNLTVPIGASAIYYGLILIGSSATNILLLAMTLNIIVAYAAHKKKSLDFGGLIAALITGILIYLSAGLIMWLSLMIFFVTSSFITHIKHDHKSKLSSEYKKSKRSYKQVIATGFAPTLLSIIYFFTKSDIFLLSAASTIATSCADTWASEIGALNKGKTISIIGFKPVKKGASGGISTLGTIMSLAGSLLIAVAFSSLLLMQSKISLHFMPIAIIGITITGFVGCIIDSLLGAAVQARYIDSATNNLTESRKTNGKSNQKVSGIGFISNNAVNLLSSAIGGFIGLLFFAAL